MQRDLDTDGVVVFETTAALERVEQNLALDA
jgi:hypothetical protein